MSDKGELNGTCNMSSCTTGKKANWYNYGSRKHYCENCARRLNADEFNQRDAMRLFGHELCKEVKQQESYPCYNCQGGGCPVCSGMGVLYN
ncbi:hypothetical protein [Tenacibaculum caenipelagi]|uniref:Uncharacterized protein n=1 Tax=Tenacibaculum caenipelagi TaxID=1325435 RepID=A0A4R6TD97_9FLAO|nr:hypothetical protein [Tenacibaculum caenipelagi]TDQ27667.1 hypothetical protein DFQ07_1518 [Tenacibaculum caenipelagi]